MNQEVKIGIEEHVLWNLCWINQTIANKPQLTRFPYFSCKNKLFLQTFFILNCHKIFLFTVIVGAINNCSHVSSTVKTSLMRLNKYLEIIQNFCHVL